MLFLVNFNQNWHTNWRLPSLSELTPYQISFGLTHLDLEASNYDKKSIYSLLLFYVVHFLISCDKFF